MDLFLFRRWYTDNSTIGELFIDSEKERECFILEPTVRVGKDHRGIVAIPQGRYEVTLYDSPKHKMICPLLNNIPGHSFVEIHIGNFPDDTLDCLLPGIERAPDAVWKSLVAFMPLRNKIEDALKTGKVWIEIRNASEHINEA